MKKYRIKWTSKRSGKSGYELAVYPREKAELAAARLNVRDGIKAYHEVVRVDDVPEWGNDDQGHNADIKNIQWHKDDCGPYWVAELYKESKKIGYTGNYYCIDENRLRVSRHEQEQEILVEYGICPKCAAILGDGDDIPPGYCEQCATGWLD